MVSLSLLLGAVVVPLTPNLILTNLPHFNEAATSDLYQPGISLCVYKSNPDHASEGHPPPAAPFGGFHLHI